MLTGCQQPDHATSSKPWDGEPVSAQPGVARHVDDRANRSLDQGLLSIKPPVLGRRTVTSIVVLGVAAIAYGGLAPFHFDLHRTLRWYLAWERPGTGDSAANVLIYVPIGIFTRLLVRRRGSFLPVEIVVGLAMAGAISYLTEVAQGMIPGRVSTWTDVVLNLFGAAIGVGVAPIAQRWLRRGHATFYVRLRAEPLSMAAAAVTLCICTYALSPPDFYPSPHRVGQAWQRFCALPSDGTPWSPAALFDASGRLHALDKLVAGCAYGLLAWMLLLSMREAGRSMAASVWHAVSRSLVLALVLESAQLFTISHVADLRDLVWAWTCAALGGCAGGVVLIYYPDLHRRPARVLKSLVFVLSLALLAWAALSLRFARPAVQPVHVSWMPMMGNFRQSWNNLLGQYVTGLLMYTFVSALVVLWYRAERRAPWAVLVVTVSSSCALLAGMIAISRYQLFDTAQVVLSIIGAAGAIRLDKAIFGKLSPVARDTPAPPYAA